MRLMYDGTNTDVPAIRKLAPRMVAGYIDGRYKWSDQDWQGWPTGCVKVRMAVFRTTSDGDVIDCEDGDATPEQAAEWVRARKAAGYYRPTVYCSLVKIPAVRVATGTLVLGRDYDIWPADWTGVSHQVTAPGPGVPVKLPATQYKSGQYYDTSMVFDDGWPHKKEPVVYPVNQTGIVHSYTTGLSAQVASHDGGKTWIYGG